MPSIRDRALASWTELPAVARRVLVADLLSTAGSGIVMPFLAIYVGRVRDLGPATGSLAVAILAAGSLPANLIAGAAADRYGARRVLVAGWALAAGGDLCLLTSAHPPTLLGSAFLIGLGAGTAYPATSTLLAEVTEPTGRPGVFAAHYGLSNVGLSLGIAASAVIVATPDLRHFQLLYVLDAATFVIAGAVLVRVRLPRLIGEPAQERPQEAPATGGGYRLVAADGAFRWLCLVQLLLVSFGFAQFHAALPVYLSRPGGLQPDKIAIVFLANTVFVAVAALPAGRLTSRYPPLTLIAAGATCFAICWLLLWQSRGSGGPAVAVAATAVVVMGVGEVLLAPAMGPLVNQLAPAHLRGRYNAADAVILSLGTITGPGLVAVLYAGASAAPLFSILIAGCLTAGLLTARPLSPARVHG